ncbi:MAG: MBL fold metallo-hydrolase [Vicinamibacterales bacterium]|nr:MBL fold metallo-hydrolase [Vicinamibacterales bacterium]MDP6609500.1 MBL fold metallo-hydrolase [Vicinamibacterales bacterium]
MTVLGSGSSGNATLVSAGGDRVLIDAGLSYRALRRRLDGVNVDPDALRAVLITHAHVDHVRGAAMLSRKHGIRIHATAAAREAWGKGADKVAGWESLAAGRPVAFGVLRFVPFGVSHDADETLGFRVETPEGAIGFATDVGQITDDLVARSSDCRMLVMESNHAVELLRVSPYAPSVRSRIGGDGGHLSNEALAAFIREHLGGQVQCIVLAHLSRINNVPALAELICREALTAAGRSDVRVVVAGQDRPTPTIALEALAPPGVARPAHRARQVALPFGSASAQA